MDDETVKTARTFLEKNPAIKKRLDQMVKDLERQGVSREAAEISLFLGKNWYPKRVYRALERLHLYDNGLSREAVHLLPTEGTARSFTSPYSPMQQQPS